MKLYRSVFGPIRSRRLGLSLGIDPLGEKICSFNCVYCEVEKTQVLTVDRKVYIQPDVILSELEHFFQSHSQVHLDYITLSGKGEPTLNSDIKIIIEEIKKRYPYPVCVITNSSLLHLKEVRDDIASADLILPSLDAVSNKNFIRINLPHRSIRIENIIEGIRLLREEFHGQIWLEILFVKSINDSKDELDLLKEKIRYIRPHCIYVNTVYRPPAFSHANPLYPDELQQIQDELSLVLNQEHIFWKVVEQSNLVSEKNLKINENDLVAELKSILSFRPSSLSDLLYVLKVYGYVLNKDKLQQQLQQLMEQNLVIARNGFESDYYQWVKS